MKLFCVIWVMTWTHLTTTASPETQQVKSFLPVPGDEEWKPLRWGGQIRQCLTARDKDASSFAIIDISQCSSAHHHNYGKKLFGTRPSGPIHLRVQHSGMCLTSELNQKGVFQLKCDERNLQQLWTVRLTGSEFVVLFNEFAEKCLDVVGKVAPTPGLSPCDSTLAQRWIF